MHLSLHVLCASDKLSGVSSSSASSDICGALYSPQSCQHEHMPFSLSQTGARHHGVPDKQTLQVRNDILDWHGDHPHTNYHELYDAMRDAGLWLEVLGSPLTCFDASQVHPGSVCGGCSGKASRVTDSALRCTSLSSVAGCPRLLVGCMLGACKAAGACRLDLLVC